MIRRYVSHHPILWRFRRRMVGARQSLVTHPKSDEHNICFHKARLLLENGTLRRFKVAIILR